MRTGAGLLLIGVGAILAFAVTTNTSVFNLHTASGYVIMLIGILGIVLPGRAARSASDCSCAAMSRAGRTCIPPTSPVTPPAPRCRPGCLPCGSRRPRPKWSKTSTRTSGCGITAV